MFNKNYEIEYCLNRDILKIKKVEIIDFRVRILKIV